ncbi:hypothetical protein Pcinc_005688 [Petrolisthes cinctipes]|uniref:Uncharacterized protein n=1 Tax=Petrolisthes cinctipes TaxID=88211 RepID=A0AAE1L295_PETCI|nr:hypothetical protein Pcinc_005688 [Petrolisthes cinctipes]
MPHSVLPYVNGNGGASRSSEEDDVEMVDSDDLNSDGELRYQVMGPDTQHPDVTRVATVAGPVLPEPPAQHPVIRVATMCPRVTGPVNPVPAAQHPVIIRVARKRAAVTGAVIPGPPAKRPAVSRPAVSHPVVSRPAVSCPAVPGPAVSHTAVSRPAVSRPAVSSTAVSVPVVSHPAVPGPAVSHPAVSHPAVSHTAVSHPAVSRPAVSHPAVSGPAVSHTAVSRPAVSSTAVSRSAVSSTAVSVPVVSRPAVPGPSRPTVSSTAVFLPVVSLPAVSCPAVPGPSRPTVSQPAIPGLGNVQRIEWSDGHDFEPDIHLYDNTASGVTPSFPVETDGTDLEYFDDQVMGKIAEETNRHHAYLVEQSDQGNVPPHSRIRDWQDTMLPVSYLRSMDIQIQHTQVVDPYIIETHPTDWLVLNGFDGTIFAPYH